MEATVEVETFGLNLQLKNCNLPKTFASKWHGKKLVVSMDEIVDILKNQINITHNYLITKPSLLALLLTK